MKISIFNALGPSKIENDFCISVSKRLRQKFPKFMKISIFYALGPSKIEIFQNFSKFQEFTENWLTKIADKY